MSAGHAGAGVDDSALLQSLTESDQRLQEEIVALRVGLASAQEKERMETQATRTAHAELERMTLHRARRAERLEVLVVDLADLESTQGELTERSVESAQSAAALQMSVDAMQIERNTLASQVREAQLQARALDSQRADAQTELQFADIREAKLQMQQSQAAARLLDEYDTTLADALGFDETPHVEPETPREVARLRRELRSYGEVNTHAAVEYNEIKERYDTMTTQQLDAEAAKEKVLIAIREIDDSTRGLFMSTFMQVGEAFEKIFKRLMGGGTTELTLTDPDNLLETGVEISVQAPGKRKQNLLLLSGGERALTAVALLFAFLEIRPAPFCVMDEVDAPLDGVNVERFASLLRDFGRTSQFLVITHNPSTMEAARCWYGVTMQEPGISRVLSMAAPEDASPDNSLATTEAMASELELADAELVGV
jgi:chromosome segregation protein